MGTIEKAGAGRAGSCKKNSAFSNFFLPGQIPLVPRPLFRSSPLNESLEQAIISLSVNTSDIHHQWAYTGQFAKFVFSSVWYHLPFLASNCGKSVNFKSSVPLVMKMTGSAQFPQEKNMALLQKGVKEGVVGKVELMYVNKGTRAFE